MKKVEVPMTYVSAKISREITEIFNILYLSFGISACILFYKFLRLDEQKRCD